MRLSTVVCRFTALGLSLAAGLPAAAEPALRLACFTSSRHGSGHLPTEPYLQQLRATLNAHFDLTLVQFESLVNPGLLDTDLLYVPTWLLAPQPGEVDALIDFVEAGGTVVFISPTDGIGGVLSTVQWVSWLSIEVGEPYSGFPSTTYTMATSADPRVTPIVDGPFGPVPTFTNRYESSLRPTGGLSFEDVGAVRLAAKASGDGSLVLVPRSVHGQGQVLIVDGLHVFADPKDEQGGFMDLPDSQKLSAAAPARRASTASS